MNGIKQEVPASSGSKTFDVFVSYSSEDRSVVEHLVQLLRDKGLSVWIDDHLKGGELLLDAIESSIKASRHFLACLSSHYELSPWTRHELAVARTIGLTTRQRKVVCLRLDSSPVPENIAPYKWRTWHDRNEQEFSDLLDDLLPLPGHEFPGADGRGRSTSTDTSTRFEWGGGPGQRPIPVILAGCGFWARNRTVLPLLHAQRGLFEIVGLTSLHPHERVNGKWYEDSAQEYADIAQELRPLLGGSPLPKHFQPDNVRLSTAIHRIRDRIGFPADAPLSVLINTPNLEHSLLAQDAIAAKCHVYSERPAIAIHKNSSIDEPTLDEIVAMASANNVVFCTGVQRRLEPSYLFMSHHVATAEFGLLTAMRVKLASGRHLGGWRRDPSQIGCGILMDEGYHLLDAAMWLLTCAFPKLDVASLKCAVNHAVLLTAPAYNPSLRVPASASGSVLLHFEEEHRSRSVWLHFDLTYDASPRSVFECLELYSSSRSFLRLYRDQPDRHPPRPGKVQYVRSANETTGSGPSPDYQVQVWDSPLDLQDGRFSPVQASENPPNYGPLLEFFTKVQEFTAVRSIGILKAGSCDAAQIVSTQKLIGEIVKGATWIDHAGNIHKKPVPGTASAA